MFGEVCSRGSAVSGEAAGEHALDEESCGIPVASGGKTELSEGRGAGKTVGCCSNITLAPIPTSLVLLSSLAVGPENSQFNLPSPPGVE